MRNTQILQTFAWITALISAAAALGTPPTYIVTDLGLLPGGTTSRAWGINQSGQIVGAANADNPYGVDRAFLYSQGEMVNIGDVIGSARAINLSGDIVGIATTGGPHAFLYSAGVVRNISNFDGEAASEALAINGAGLAVGSATVPIGGGQYQVHAFLYDGVQTIDLNSAYFELDYSTANGINDAGWIVGEARHSGLDIRGFLLRDGQVTFMGTLGGANSEAAAVNAAGLIAGSSYLADNMTEHAVLFSNGEVIDLGILTGGLDSFATALNADGVVVGACTFTGSHNRRAFVYVDGQMVDLNAQIPAGSGWLLQDANSINDAGQIVGAGRLNGLTRAFLLTPNPGCPGDLNGDRQVGLPDLALLLAHFGTPSGASPADGDLDADGDVDLQDLAMLLAVFGSTCL